MNYKKLINNFLQYGSRSYELRGIVDPFLSIPLEKLPRLPYGNPYFNKKLLQLHLNQETDQASRRISVIKKQIEWIVNSIGIDNFQHVLHPMCGPGLFALCLASIVNSYFGIDINLSVIRYAQEKFKDIPNFTFKVHDVRKKIKNQELHSLCLLTYESINAFPPHELIQILKNCNSLLYNGCYLVVDIRPLFSF